MKQRGKRRQERESERGNGNVIPLHAGLREAPGAVDSRGGERVDASGERRPDRSVEQPKSQRPGGLDQPKDSGERVSDHGQTFASDLHHDDDHPDVRDFFAKAPKSIAPSGEPWADLDGPEHDASAGTTHHRGMFWTLGIAGVGLLLIGLFLLYNKVLMPTPEEFVIKLPIALPTPDMLKSNTPAEPPVVAPVDQAPPAGTAQALANAMPARLPVEPADVPGGNVEAAPSVPATTQQAELASSDYATLLAGARKLGFRKPAEELYLKAIALHPAEADAVSGLAMLYLNQGKNQQAKERAEQAIGLSSSSDEGFIVLGAAESALGKERAARDAYARCAALPAGKYVAECKRLSR